MEKRERQTAEKVYDSIRPKWIGLMQLLFIVAMAASPFLWIWIGFSIAWKTALTGLLGVIIMFVISESFKRICIPVIEKKLKDDNYDLEQLNRFINQEEAPKSNFRKRLE